MSKESLDGLKKAFQQDEKAFERAIEKLTAPIQQDSIQKYFAPTKRTKATVRVMVSYNFCHFEETIELTGEDISLQEIDSARKDCQRLVDKAVSQYKTAKEKEAKRANNSYERMQLEKEVAEIQKKKDEFLTPEDKAKIKALEYFNYQHRYDYDDDDLYTSY